MNGALNLSILDGWWAEFAGDDYGWVIPSADAAGDAGERDALEAAALYELLEHQRRDAVLRARRRRRAARVGAPRPAHARDARARARRRPHGEAVRRGALPPGRRAGGARGGRRRPRRPRARGIGRLGCGRPGPRCRSRTWSRAGSSRPHVGDELRAARLRRARRAVARRRHRSRSSTAAAATDETIEGVRRTPLAPDRRPRTDAASELRRARACTPARSCSTGRGRSATRCGWCRGIRCSCRPPSSGSSPSPTEALIGRGSAVRRAIGA